MLSWLLVRAPRADAGLRTGVGACVRVRHQLDGTDSHPCAQRSDGSVGRCCLRVRQHRRRRPCSTGCRASMLALRPARRARAAGHERGQHGRGCRSATASGRGGRAASGRAAASGRGAVGHRARRGWSDRVGGGRATASAAVTVLDVDLENGDSHTLSVDDPRFEAVAAVARANVGRLRLVALRPVEVAAARRIRRQPDAPWAAAAARRSCGGTPPASAASASSSSSSRPRGPASVRQARRPLLLELLALRQVRSTSTIHSFEVLAEALLHKFVHPDDRRFRRGERRSHLDPCRCRAARGTGTPRQAAPWRWEKAPSARTLLVLVLDAVTTISFSGPLQRRVRSGCWMKGAITVEDAAVGGRPPPRSPSPCRRATPPSGRSSAPSPCAWC